MLNIDGPHNNGKRDGPSGAPLAVPGALSHRRVSLQGVLSQSQRRRASSYGHSTILDASFVTGGDSDEEGEEDGGGVKVNFGSADLLANRKTGRFEALTALRSVQAAEKVDVRRSTIENSYWGSSASQSRSGFLLPPSIPESRPSVVGPVKKRPGSLWNSDETDELATFRQKQHQQLSADSSIDDIRRYGQAVQHPGKLMKVLPDEYDRDVQTEFDVTCNELLNVLGEFETALEEMTIWKDDFLKQTVPSNIKLQLTLLFARLFRSKSDLHEPMFELIKQVRVYSRPWLNKSFSLLALEKDYQRQCHMIDVAIRKMEQMQLQVATIRSEKRVALWEKLTRRVMEVFPEYEGQFTDAAEVIPAPPPQPEPEVVEEESETSLSEICTSVASSSSSEAADQEAEGVRQEEDEEDDDRPYGTLKDSIREYISEDRPSWKRAARELVRNFRNILQDCHPDFHNILGRLHRRPFPRRIQPLYLSEHTGSIDPRPRRLPNLRKSWSLPDLQLIARAEDRGSTAEATQTLRRSNSFGAVHQFGRRYQIRQLFEEASMERHVAMEEQERYSDRNSENSEEEDDRGMFTQEESMEGLRYMADYDEEEMQEAVNRFMEERPMVFTDDAPQDDEPTPAEKKVTFTLQEVMELTMLHGQQMQLLQFEYESRIEKLHEAMADQEATHEEKCDAYEARVEALHQRTKRIAQEYQKQAKEVVFAETLQVQREESERRSPSSRGHGSSRNGSSRPRSRSAERSPSRSAGLPTSRQQNRQSRRLTSRQRGRRDAKHVRIKYDTKLARARQASMSRHTPVFQSAPFAMSFMDRLRWYTELKLQKRSSIQQKFRRIEIAANEERLKQYQLLSGPTDSSAAGPATEPNQLPAEFMPMPGEVPPVKRRELWGQQGIHMPWGGRYNVHRGKKREGAGINILNLFDVAMSIEMPARGDGGRSN
ncbi:hypothetical protein HKX48_006972 [Thoreauomyces humboldtii]|nr:hypothetical protein HKX48_006972 [Thoreauomyces humboldtii]